MRGRFQVKSCQQIGDIDGVSFGGLEMTRCSLENTLKCRRLLRMGFVRQGIDALGKELLEVGLQRFEVDSQSAQNL